MDEIDDRVCLYYVIERVGDCIEHIETASDVLECPALTEELYDFHKELVHALGANQVERKRNGENERFVDRVARDADHDAVS